MRPGRNGGVAGAGRRRRAPGVFKDIFQSVLSSGGEAETETEAQKGRRPRVRLNIELLAGRPRHPGQNRNQPLRPLPHLPRQRRHEAGSIACPQCKRHRQREPDGRQHEVQPHLPAYAMGKAASRMPARHATAMGASRTRRSWKCVFPLVRRTVRACACRAKAMPAPWARPREIFTSPPRGSSSILPARRR